MKKSDMLDKVDESIDLYLKGVEMGMTHNDIVKDLFNVSYKSL